MTREEAIKRLKEARNTIQPFRYVDEAIDYVIKALEQEPCDDCVSRGVFEQVVWERDTAIEQLRKLGYELGQKIEPCDDCVSRKAVIAEMRNLYPDIPLVDFNNARLKWTRKYKPYLDCEKVVKSMPSVLPKREQGEWIEQSSNKEQGEREHIWWKCSQCGQVIFSETERDRKEFHAFCSKCGAEMR